MHRIVTPPTTFRRRLNGGGETKQMISGVWNGFFILKDESYNPNEIYDPNHCCAVWKQCCSTNLLLKPRHLSTKEEESGSKLNIKRVQSIETELVIIKKQLLKALNKNIETKQNAMLLMGIMKTYSWLCSELIRLKFEKES
jgi:hypothetical protein